MTPRYRYLSLALALLCLVPSLALADCLITGTVTAQPNTTDPLLPAWRYTLTVVWDTGTPYALSHFNMLLSQPGEICTCDDFASTLVWVDPAGASDGEPEPCRVDYDLILECSGDPSLGIADILLKFEPVEVPGCEPGPAGSGVFTFWSDWAPAPIDEPNLFLVDKHGQLACYGQLIGVFPGLPCDPTPAPPQTWGGLKTTYR